MGSYKGFERRLVSLAHFSQHPSDGFVHQIVLVSEKLLRKCANLSKLARFDERERGHHRNALLPKIPRASEGVKGSGISLFEHNTSDEIGSGTIDEIPVVHRTNVAEIKL